MIRRRSSWRALALSGAMLTAFAQHPVVAQVIEIADDGTATTYAQPTRFVSASAEAMVDTPRSIALTPSRDAFELAAQRHNIDPALLRAVAWRESRFNNRAVSAKGALGTMQLMPATARALGVDPTDEAANIAGGAAYLAQQLGRFAGSVPLALAAYNAGPGAVARYNGIPPYAETQSYVSAIMQRWQGKAVASIGAPVARVATRFTIPSFMIEVPTP